MEIGGVNKQALPSSQSAPQRVDPPVSSGSVKTELSREAAVQQIEEISPVRFEPSAGARDRAALEAAMQRTVERRMEIDENSRDVVFRARDQRTGEVVTQIPTEQTLKLRAYLRETTASQGGSISTPRSVIG